MNEYKQEFYVSKVKELLKDSMWYSNMNSVNSQLKKLSVENQALLPNELTYQNRSAKIAKAIKHWINEGIYLDEELSYRIATKDGSSFLEDLLPYININAKSGSNMTIATRCIYKGISTKKILEHKDFNFNDLSIDNKDRVLTGLFSNTHIKTVCDFLKKYPNCLDDFKDSNDNYWKISHSLPSFLLQEKKAIKSIENLKEARKIILNQLKNSDCNFLSFVKESKESFEKLRNDFEKTEMESKIQLSSVKGKKLKF